MPIDTIDIMAAALAAEPVVRPPLAIVPAAFMAGIAAAVQHGPLDPQEERYIGSLDNLMAESRPILAALNEALAKHDLEVVQDEMMCSTRTFSIRRVRK